MGQHMLLLLLCAKKHGKMSMIPALMRVPGSDSESIASLFSSLIAYLILARKDGGGGGGGGNPY